MATRIEPRVRPPAPEPVEGVDAAPTAGWLLVYLALGVAFGFVLIRAEVVSWFRIQEMFRFQSFHMYGVFASALLVATPLNALLKRAGRRALNGAPIRVPPKVLGSGRRYVYGGLTFGVGWALTGACPGPLFALTGAGVHVMLVTFLGALLGTWTYGYLRPRLPH